MLSQATETATHALACRRVLSTKQALRTSVPGLFSLLRQNPTFLGDGREREVARIAIFLVSL
jgi:hypothetical protein